MPHELWAILIDIVPAAIVARRSLRSCGDKGFQSGQPLLKRTDLILLDGSNCIRSVSASLRRVEQPGISIKLVGMD
jgi:hypothetical protein